ncbi:MAG TPA: monovalent cation/H+ antiporter complex subunit F [Thermoanaerobaculia bacterium]
MTVVIEICFAMLSISLVLALIRLILGPGLPDRVVALDLIAVIVVGMIIVYDIATEMPVFLDAAIMLALVGFAGTVAFAKYLERRAGPD